MLLQLSIPFNFIGYTYQVLTLDTHTFLIHPLDLFTSLCLPITNIPSPFNFIGYTYQVLFSPRHPRYLPLTHPILQLHRFIPYIMYTYCCAVLPCCTRSCGRALWTWPTCATSLPGTQCTSIQSNTTHSLELSVTNTIQYNTIQHYTTTHLKYKFNIQICLSLTQHSLSALHPHIFIFIKHLFISLSNTSLP